MMVYEYTVALMSGENSSDPKFDIGHVLFFDIVGYSKLLINEQSQLLQRLKELVRGTQQFQLAETEGNLLRLPTGDGGALVFRNSPEAPVQCALELSRGLKNHPELQVRMGIHSGPVNEVADLNERMNVAGAGINIAQRVMDCGDAGHILLSKHVAEDLEHYARWRAYLHDLGECEVKHGSIISVVNFFGDDFGNPAPPEKVKTKSDGRPVIPGTHYRIARSALIAAGGAILLVAIGLFVLFHGIAPVRRSEPAAAVVSSKSIAVLPFENLSHDQENAYFADCIQDEILTRLSKIADLKVISRTSTQRYKSSPNNLPQIAKQLGVANILEGSVQKAADQVRVNVQLINAAADTHLWAETFDRKLTDIFAVESEIAATIADRLKAKLTGAEQRAISSRPTENSEAHQLYLKGRFYWNRWLGPNFEKSREYYEQAIALDPGYALPYAGLADYYGFSFANGLLPPEEKWARTEEDAANKALQLDPALGEAYNPLAAAKLYYHRDWPAAEAYFRRGIELNPNFAEIHNHYALCLVFFGRNDEAFAEMRRAIELDPLSSRFAISLARLHFFLRQYDGSIEQFQKAFQLEPNDALAHEWLGYAYEKKKMQKEAITEWAKSLRLKTENEQASLLEETFAKSGFDPAVRALARENLRRLNEKTGRGEYVPAGLYVRDHMRAGNKEEAFAWLAKAVEERNRLALEIKINPVFDPLRDDPRFEQLIAKIFPAKSRS